MPLSFQTHKSNQEISQIIDNLNVTKNGKLSTQSGTKTGDEIVTAKDVKLMTRFYLTKDKRYTSTRAEIEGISESERVWDFEQIFPSNFKVKKVVQMCYNTTTAATSNSFTYKTISGTYKTANANESTSSRGVVIDITNDIYYLSYNLRVAGSATTWFGVDSGSTMDAITKVEYTEVSLPDAEKNKFILAVEGYFD